MLFVQGGGPPPQAQVPGSSSITDMKPGLLNSLDQSASLGAKFTGSHSRPSSRAPPGEANTPTKSPLLFLTWTICERPSCPKYNKSPTPTVTPLIDPSVPP